MSSSFQQYAKALKQIPFTNYPLKLPKESVPFKSPWDLDPRRSYRRLKKIAYMESS
jgi:hypothetical protein